MTTAAAERASRPASPRRFLRTWLFLELLPAFAAIAMLLSNGMLVAMFNGDGSEPDLPAVVLWPAAVLVVAFVVALFLVLGFSLLVLFLAGIGWIASDRALLGIAIAVPRAIITWAMLGAADLGWREGTNVNLMPLASQVVLLSIASASALWLVTHARASHDAARSIG
ncbi:MAG TPA: hypothetical protein VFH62_09310 [Dehalococcoidia bacterium]|jgi:hypothetical protein|nr:hypothetical protein [Dehalococcoidia bacterium]